MRYFRELWRGELPLARVFWNDMLVVGTLVNVVFLLAAVLLFVAGVPAWLGFAVHLAPIPYNFVVATGVSRSAEREPPEWRWLARAIAVGWFVACILI
jgi:hypothetical protein